MASWPTVSSSLAPLDRVVVVGASLAGLRACEALRSGGFGGAITLIGAETHLPFGGVKETGNGHREAGHAALDTYTEWKSIYVDFSGRLQRAQIDNQPI